MSKNQTMSLFDDVPDEIICAPSPPLLAHQVLNQSDLGDSKISVERVTKVALPIEGKAKEKQSQSIAPRPEDFGGLELLPLATPEGIEEESDKRGLAHWQSAAETFSQIAFRLASTTSAR